MLNSDEISIYTSSYCLRYPHARRPCNASTVVQQEKKKGTPQPDALRKQEPAGIWLHRLGAGTPNIASRPEHQQILSSKWNETLGSFQPSTGETALLGAKGIALLTCEKVDEHRITYMAISSCMFRVAGVFPLLMEEMLTPEARDTALLNRGLLK